MLSKIGTLYDINYTFDVSSIVVGKKDTSAF